MAPTCPSSARARARASNHQGVEAPRPQVFTQKDTQRGIKLQTTPRDGTEHGEGESDAQGTGIYRTRRHHPGPAGDWDAGQGRQGRGAGVHMVEACRERKGTLDGITLGTTGT